MRIIKRTTDYGGDEVDKERVVDFMTCIEFCNIPYAATGDADNRDGGN